MKNKAEITWRSPKSRPIIYSRESIEAFLNTLPGGKPKNQSLPVKTMTRRIVNPQPTFKSLEGETERDYVGVEMDDGTFGFVLKNDSGMGVSDWNRECPHGFRMDYLWVRESVLEVFGKDWESEPVYRGDGANRSLGVDFQVERGEARWRSPRFMFKKHARYTQKILAIRVERLQDITEADARLEGARKNHEVFHDSIQSSIENTYVRNFAVGWDRLNKIRGYGWDSNLWVWVLAVGSLEKFAMEIPLRRDKKK